MTSWSDLEDEMRKRPLDDGTVDRLLSGRLYPDDAPPGLSEVAQLLRAVAAPARAEELAGEHETVAAATARVRNGARLVPTARRSSMRRRFVRVKMAGLVVTGTLIGSTGLAAAGVLPDAAQNAAASVLSKVGITIPAAGDETSSTDEQATTIEHPASTGSEISTIATTTRATGVAKGAEISATASGGMSQAGLHGSQAGGTDTAPPVETPNPGGAGTADQASGGASGAGTTTASEASGGHSSAGSVNAGEHAPSGGS